jgi:coenzyme F420-0:L-glutamate ligase/coenzyme F420-1:gamma-L-glutamate ligase
MRPKDSLLNFLEDWRSIRTFKDEPIPTAVAERLLRVACRAPSAHNSQPWRFVVLAEDDAKQRLVEAMGARLRGDRLADGDDLVDVEEEILLSRTRICGAPLVVLLCLTMEGLDRYPDEERSRAEFLMAVQGAAMAGYNLMLAARAEGLGACWLCAPIFAPQAAKESLALPQGWEPQGLVLMGHPLHEGTKRERMPVDKVSLWR